MILSNKATEITSAWISTNGYWKEIKNLKSVDEFKRWVLKKVWKGEAPSESFIKGARIINWESLYKASQHEVQKNKDK